MKIHNFSTTQQKNFTLFSADVTYRHKFARKLDIPNYIFQKIKNHQMFFSGGFSRILFDTEKIWFKVPNSISQNTQWHDAFYIVGLVLSLKRGEVLEFSGTVSNELLKKASEIERYYRFEAQPRKIMTIMAKSSPSLSNNQPNFTQPPQKSFAQFFTLGVDSFYTLARNMRKKNQPLNLLFVDGYDIPLTQKKFLRSIHQHIQQVAKEVNGDAIFIETNLRDLSDNIMNWGQFHGAALAAVSYLTIFKTMHINGESFDWPDWGLRFGLDTLFSTHQTTLSLVGHHITRDKKILSITQTKLFPLFLKHLRVCWANASSPIMRYNCSKCQKCLRTKLILMSLGITNTPTFKDIDLKALKQIKIAGHVRQEWTFIYEQLQKKNHKYRWLLPTLHEVLQKPLLV